MKVAFVVTNKLEVNLLNYNNQELGRAKVFAFKGYDVDIYVFSKKKKGSDIIFETNNNIVRLIYYKGIIFFGNQTIPLNLLTKIQSNKYTSIFLHEYPWIIPFIVARKYKKTQTNVILVQGVYEDFNSKIKKLYNLLFDFFVGKRFIKKLDGIIFKTRGAQNYFTAKGYNIVPSKIIPVGLDTNRFKKPLNEVIKINDKNKIQESFSILYIGVLEDRRNPFFLLDLLERLVKIDNRYILTVIGKGKLLEPFKKEVSGRHLSSNIIHLESCKQEVLPWFYKNSNVLVLPSSYEIFGMVLLEALYFNLPIISTSTAGAIEILENSNVDSILDLDVEKWIERILELNEFKTIKSNGLPQKYEWNHIVDETIEFCINTKK